MMTFLRSLTLLCAFARLTSTIEAASQIAQPGSAIDKLEDQRTMAQLTELRDGFVKQIVTEGFSCPIKPPVIVLRQTPSFGNYDEDSNTVFTSAWHQLSPEEQGFFAHIAGPGADAKAVRTGFEGAAHRWIFIHELGHWWQNCKKVDRTSDHYQQEYEANRIAAAYWRKADPAFLARIVGVFHAVYEAGPNPVPEGVDPVKFFNDNYGEALAKTNAYPWFQSKMNVGVDAEKPAPTFARALRETGK